VGAAGGRNKKIVQANGEVRKKTSGGDSTDGVSTGQLFIDKSGPS